MISGQLVGFFTNKQLEEKPDSVDILRIWNEDNFNEIELPCGDFIKGKYCTIYSKDRINIVKWLLEEDFLLLSVGDDVSDQELTLVFPKIFFGGMFPSPNKEVVLEVILQVEMSYMIPDSIAVDYHGDSYEHKDIFGRPITGRLMKLRGKDDDFRRWLYGYNVSVLLTCNKARRAYFIPVIV